MVGSPRTQAGTTNRKGGGENDGAVIVMPIPDDAPAHDGQLFRHLGQPSAAWEYHDAKGQLIGGVLRWDTPSDKDRHHKEFRPLTLWRTKEGKLEWRSKHWPDPRPLYGLDWLAQRPDAPVLVCEGEKAADAARKLFPDHVCIASPGGANAAGNANWTPLKGRAATIWPDNDDPGRGYARNVARLTQAAGALQASIVQVPSDWSEGWDLANNLPAGVVLDGLRTMLEAALTVAAPEGPLPLRRAMPEAPEFPVHALGGLRAAAEAIHDLTQAPMAICAQSVLAVASLATQAHVDIVLPMGSQKPASCFFVTVAESGERKSSCDDLAMRSVDAFTEKLRSAREKELADYRADESIWEGSREKLLKKLNNDNLATIERASIEADLRDLENSRPLPPPEPRIKCGEPTIEGLFKQLKQGLGFVGLMSAEGGTFIGGFGMSADHRLKTAGYLSLLWDGSPIDRTRAGEDMAVLVGRRLSLHLMMQPNVAANILADSELIGQGLIGRILIAAPAPTAGRRMWRDAKPGSESTLERFHGTIAEILERPRQHRDKRPAELTPRPLPLSNDARTIWVDYHDKNEVQLGPDGQLHPISSLAAKLPEHAARLAAVLAAFANIDAAEVDGDAMMDGMALAEFYKAEALRLFEAGMTDPDLALAERALTFIKGRGGPVSLRCIYTHGPNAAREKATAERIMKVLEDHRQIEMVSDVQIDGRTVRKAWRLVE
jgi:hypothetical protein